jgi:hypothetical protein
MVSFPPWPKSVNLSWRKAVLTPAGPIVRTGPNSLSFNTTEALKAIYTDRNANIRRGEWYKSADIASRAYSTNTCMDKQEHSFRRRIIGQAFSERALRDAEPFVVNNVQILCDKLGTGAEKPGEWTPKKDLNKWVTYFSLDFVSDLSFGKSFGTMVKDEWRCVSSLLMETNQFVYYVNDYSTCTSFPVETK